MSFIAEFEFAFLRQPSKSASLLGRGLKRFIKGIRIINRHTTSMTEGGLKMSKTA